MDVAAKLQLKAGMTVPVVAAPDEVALDLPEANPAADEATADAVIAFVTLARQLDDVAASAIAAALDDRLAWIAYPKSRQLGTDLNRDTLAALVTARGARPVRSISIDRVWSAIRFRPL